MQASTDNNTSSSQSVAAAAPVRVWGLTPLAWWRGFTVFFLILLIFAAATGMSMFEQFKAQVTHLQKQLLVLPQIKYIAVLLDGQSAPALLVTLDPTENSLVLQRLGSIKEGREDSLQLWALPATGAPRSLGLLASGSQTLRIPGTEKDLRDVPQLGVSVESKGGVEDSHGPSGPLLLKGAVVQKAL